MGFEPMNTGFADQRVSHFATGALVCLLSQAAQLTSAALLYGGTASLSYSQERSCLRPH
jgi:hypothetical protein